MTLTTTIESLSSLTFTRAIFIGLSIIGVVCLILL